MDLDQNIFLRTFSEDQDRNLVYNSWLVGIVDFVKPHIGTDIFFKHHGILIDEIMRHSNCVIAVNPEEENQIFGYIVYSKNILHYVYVKSAYRRLRIARFLLDFAFRTGIKVPVIIATHMTPGGELLLNNYKNVFNPYKLFNLNEKDYTDAIRT